MTPIPQSDRPLDARRTDYRAFGLEDQFIVPLLAELIDGALQKFAVTDKPDAKALDAGCGGQPFRLAIESRGFKYVGLDVVQNPAGSVDVLGLVDAKDLPEVDDRGPYDLILCTEVLEHVPNWEQSFTNFSRWLAPGGRLILTAPFFWKLHEVPYDFWRPTLHAFRAFGQRFGLRELESREGGSARLVTGSALAQLTIREKWSNPYGIFWRKVFSFSRRLLIRLITGGWVDRVVQVNSPFYLTSFIVLEKPRT